MAPVTQTPLISQAKFLAILAKRVAQIDPRRTNRLATPSRAVSFARVLTLVLNRLFLRAATFVSRSIGRRYGYSGLDQSLRANALVKLDRWT
jgi:hypothetical protein